MSLRPNTHTFAELIRGIKDHEFAHADSVGGLRRQRLRHITLGSSEPDTLRQQSLDARVPMECVWLLDPTRPHCEYP
jgi:hypothetical protein